jgi:hypothetical protein
VHDLPPLGFLWRCHRPSPRLRSPLCARLGAFAGDIKKAKDAGHHTVESMLMTTKKVRLLLAPVRRLIAMCALVAD